MTLAPEDKIALSDVRMKKADVFLDDARANLEGGRFSTAINRCYYSALASARAILILEGVTPESHDGATTMLSLRFVKPGVLPAETVRMFKLLLSRRTDADYGDFETASEDDAVDSYEAAKTIRDMIEAARKGIISRLAG